MASICNISEHFCDWRSHLNKGDSIQAHDGRGWFAATIYAVRPQNNGSNTKDLLIGYNNYSSEYDFWCSRYSKRIRPTIGFLRKKIMAPQAKRICELQQENKKIKQENKVLLQFKNKFNEKQYQYLSLKKLSSSSLKHGDSSNDQQDIDEVIDEEEIEEILMKNVKILSEWNTITKELDILNEELNEELNEDSNDNKNVDIKDLVRIQTMMAKRIEIQQQRLESSQNNVILPVMNRKFKINDKINEYSEILKDIKSKYSDDFQKYEIINNDCKQLINSLYDLQKYCNQKINEENELNAKQRDIKNKIFKLENYINQYQDYSSSYFDLLKGFQKFQVLNKKYISNSSKQINYKWQCIESLWFKWESDDILLWIQHKMNWMNKYAVPNCLNFDVILENMERKNINGKSLITLKKIDLLHIGFKIHSHRTIIYQYIKALITKNNNIDNDDDNDEDDDNDDNNNDDHEEGQQISATTTTNNNHDHDIPDKYKCSLTSKLMSDPVICGHNNMIYEKSAIYKYINKNGKLPNSMSANQININDDSSFLLFDDLSLKIEIEQFKQENNL